MKRTFTAVLAGLLAGAALIGVTAGPAAGGVLCNGNVNTAPDGRIRLAGGDWTGGNQYPSTFVDVVLPVGQVQQYELQWRNRGGDFLTIKAKLGSLDKAGYGIKIFAYGLNVTKNVRHGKAIVFQHVPAGKRTGIVTVQIRNKEATMFAAGVLFYGYYGGNPNPTVNCDSLFAAAND